MRAIGQESSPARIIRVSIYDGTPGRGQVTGVTTLIITSGLEISFFAHSFSSLVSSEVASDTKRITSALGAIEKVATCVMGVKRSKPGRVNDGKPSFENLSRKKDF
jgi:hypothetical protein